MRSIILDMREVGDWLVVGELVLSRVDFLRSGTITDFLE